jgi:rhamnulokinase
MAATRKLLAIDLGAESGRGVVGHFDGERLRLQDVHRFPNGGVPVLDALHWDVLRLHADILTAIRKAAAEGGLDGIGVDTWGVDFGLLGRGGVLLGNPRHYRDPHTEGAMELAFARVPKPDLYRQTGIQFMRFNSLFQLVALKRDGSPVLDAAESLLFMPDLFHYFLTGIRSNEFTDASTGQVLDPTTRRWATGVLDTLGIPPRLFGTLTMPGTVLGPLRPSVAKETGAGPVSVVAPASHDTAAAVASVPARGDDWAFISSGTWSLVGAEIPQPVVTEAALAANFTNEGGVGGTTRFLKNVMGLWLVQECRRCWQRAGRDHGYDELTRLAGEAPAFGSMIDPDDASFILPEDMPGAVAAYCRRTNQPVPDGVGPVVRCCLESLALKYRWVLETIESLLGRRLAAVHVVGGGCQNALLCQLTADCCGRPVLAGPVEATAAGNVLTQALGLGLVGSLADVREVVRRSFDPVAYEPRDRARWDDAYGRFRALLGK